MWGPAKVVGTRRSPVWQRGASGWGHQAWAHVEHSLFLGQVVLGCSAVTGNEAGFQRRNHRGWQVTGFSPGQLPILTLKK